MSWEAIKTWYKGTYPGDPAADSDHFIISGYKLAMDWHGIVYEDAFEALNSGEVSELLNGRGYAIRAFVRAYNKGVEDRPVIVEGNAISVIKRLPT